MMVKNEHREVRTRPLNRTDARSREHGDMDELDPLVHCFLDGADLEQALK